MNTDWFRTEGAVRQGCLLSPGLFTLYSEHLMRNARLGELYVRSKISRRNINNFRYVDDITPTAESKKELKNLLMRVKEESKKASLKLNIKNN